MTLFGFDEGKSASLRPFAYLALGAMIAIYSTIPVLDPQASLWNNDEGYFLGLAQSRGNLFDVRYSLFATLGKLYFVLLGKAFAVVLAHKLLMLAAFVWIFYERISSKHGEAVYIGLYTVFVFLNQFFLRDSAIFLCSLLVVWFGACRSRCGEAYAGLGMLIFLRPQALLLYARPWVALVAGAIFLLFFRNRYAVSQMPAPQFLMRWEFWGEVAYTAAVAVSGFNPFGKLSWYVENQRYFGFILLVLASLPFGMLCAQFLAASVLRDFRFPGWDSALAGMFLMILLYAALGIYADVRIFLATLCPFFLHIHRCFLTLKSVVLMGLAFVLLALMKLVVISAIAGQ